MTHSASGVATWRPAGRLHGDNRRIRRTARASRDDGRVVLRLFQRSGAVLPAVGGRPSRNTTRRGFRSVGAPLEGARTSDCARRRVQPLGRRQRGGQLRSRSARRGLPRRLRSGRPSTSAAELPLRRGHSDSRGWQGRAPARASACASLRTRPLSPGGGADRHRRASPEAHRFHGQIRAQVVARDRGGQSSRPAQRHGGAPFGRAGSRAVRERHLARAAVHVATAQRRTHSKVTEPDVPVSSSVGAYLASVRCPYASRGLVRGHGAPAPHRDERGPQDGSAAACGSLEGRRRR